jgi:hypothetical protein
MPESPSSQLTSATISKVWLSGTGGIGDTPLKYCKFLAKRTRFSIGAVLLGAPRTMQGSLEIAIAV